MTFFQFAAIDALLFVILGLHIATGYVRGIWKTVLSALDVCAHIAVVVMMLFYGCTPDEMLVVLLSSAIIAIALGLRECRRIKK